MSYFSALALEIARDRGRIGPIDGGLIHRTAQQPNDLAILEVYRWYDCELLEQIAILLQPLRASAYRDGFESRINADFLTDKTRSLVIRDCQMFSLGNEECGAQKNEVDVIYQSSVPCMTQCGSVNGTARVSPVAME